MKSLSEYGVLIEYQHGFRAKRSTETQHICVNICNRNTAHVCVHMQDFNADLLNPDKPTKDGRNLLDLIEIFGLDCLITKATRKTKTSETLLDLILTSNKKKTLVSDVVDTQISDHSLVFTILRSRAPRSRSRKICVRGFKNFNRDKFIQDLQMAPFSIVDVFDEVDDKLYALNGL